VSYSHLFEKHESEFTISVGHREYKNGVPSENYVAAGINVTFGSAGSGYSNHKDTRKKPTEFLNQALKNEADPRSIGVVRERKQKVLVEETITYTVMVLFGKVKVNPDSTITVEFGSGSNGAQKPMLAASPNPDVPSSNQSYSIKIINPEGITTEYQGVNPPWTSQKMPVGKYTLILVTTNTVDGKSTRSESSPTVVDIVEDNQETLGSLEIVSVDYTTAILNFKGTKDANGVKNELWSVVGSSTASVSAPTETNTLVVTGGTPGETITVLYTFEYNKMNADGTDNWVK